ncbi:MAG TPA: TolC family protein [Bacillota bacterium]|nr:TolC family protein [Bacillota bacterium]
MKVIVKSWRVLHYLIIILVILGFSLACLAEQPVPQKLTIDQAIRTAMENSLQRQAVQGDVNVARDKMRQALSAYGPKITIDCGYNHYNEVPATVQLNQGLVDMNNALLPVTGASYLQRPDDSLNYYGYQLKLTQPLYTGSKLTATKNAAKANEKNAQANLDATDNDLVLSVKKAYYTVLLCQQLGVTMDEAVASMEKHLAEANAYYKVNIVTKLDVLRAEEKLADLKQKQLLAQNNLALAKTSLNYLLGVDLGTNYSCEDSLGYGPILEDLNSCQNVALAQRPELASINAKIEMARQGVVIAKSGKKPTVALVANDYHFKPENEAPSTTIGIVATFDLFDSGMVSHRIAEAEEILKQAQTGKELLQRGIKLEVEQAYRNVQVSLQTIDVARKSIDTAKEALGVAETRYKVGLSTSLERLDAEVGLTVAKTNYTQALSMYRIAIAELDRAMGKQPEGN